MGFYQIYKYRFQFIHTDTVHLLGSPTQWFIRFFNFKTDPPVSPGKGASAAAPDFTRDMRKAFPSFTSGACAW